MHEKLSSWKNKDDEYILRIKTLFLENNFVPGKYKLKLKPEIDNTDVYEKISNNSIEELKANNKKYAKNNLLKVYLFIEKYIARWYEEYGIEKMFNLFSKVKLVQIIIEQKDNVDPHRIFESINSTGLDLTNFDLIRNFILMNHDDEKQEKLYNDLWKPLEERIFKINKKSTDRLMRILIQFLKKDYVTEKEIYKNFKEVFSNSNEKDIIKKLNYALELYEYFYYVDNDKIDHVSYNSLIHLQPNKNELYSTIYMMLLEKKRLNLIDTNTYDKSIKLLSEYILRRKIADLDTSPITRFFNETLIKKLKNSNEDTLSVLNKELFENTRNTQMYAPTINEIKNKLLTINFYDLAVCKTVFWYLENWNNPIHLRFRTLTIEHIAPQSPSKGDWIKKLGVNDLNEYQEKINLLGNLTILPEKANNRLANHSWEEKRNKLMEYKHIKINEDLLDLENFDVDTLLKRQNVLIEKFFEIFS